MTGALIWMLIVCIVPDGRGHLKKAWQIHERVPLEHCLTMNRYLSAEGRAGAITITCGAPK